MVSRASVAFVSGIPANDGRIRSASKRIVVATDLSPGADLAVRRAIMLAKRHGGSVTLAHVVDDKGSRRRIQEAASRARWFLEDWYGPTGERAEFELDIRVAAGAPADAVAEIAASEGADLLVFGGPRRRFLADMVSGATMERVVRASGLPALTVNLPPRRAYQRILVGFNASDASRLAVAKALELDLMNAPEIDLVHAFTVLGKSRMVYSGIDPEDAADHVARAAAEARMRVREFLSTSGLPEFRRRIHVVEGEPDWAVERLAASLSAELVIIGSPAVNGLSRLVLGSVAGDILRRVRCDVLVVPATVQRRFSDSERQDPRSVMEPLWSVAS
jgi:nucleotide-binding universal stress UspA family protein